MNTVFNTILVGNIKVILLLLYGKYFNLFQRYVLVRAILAKGTLWNEFKPICILLQTLINHYIRYFNEIIRLIEIYPSPHRDVPHRRKTNSRPSETTDRTNQ